MFFKFQTGESLVDGGHYACDDIEARVEQLFAKWEELLEATNAKRVGLEQALSLLYYRRKVAALYKVCPSPLDPFTVKTLCHHDPYYSCVPITQHSLVG